MSSCRLQYIDELPDSDETKDRLTKLHLDVASRLYRHRINNSGYVDQLFKFTGDKLFVPGERFYFNEAQKYIKILNDDLGFIGVRLIQDTVNKARHYVEVDVRPDKTLELSENANANMQTFYKNYFGETALLTENFELEDEVENHKEIFKNLTDRIFERGVLYLDTSTEDNYTTRNLKMIIGSLKDKSTYGIIESLNKYVVTASYSLNNLNKRLSIIDEKMRNLSSEPTVRKQQLKQISDFVRYSSYYYHLFDTLDDIKHELKVLGVNERKIDRYERDLLEDGLKEWLTSKEVFNEGEITDFLNQVPSLIEDSGAMFNNVKQQYKQKLNGLTSDQSDNLYDEMMDILNKSMKKEGSIQQSLLNTIDGLSPFKQRLKDLHYETLVEIYYPVFEASFDEGKMSIDGKISLDEKWRISKDDFKSLLMLGEEDISQLSKWGSAMINVKETIPVTIANFFKDVVIDIDLNNKEDIGELQKFLSKNKRIDGDAEMSRFDEIATHENLLIEKIEEVDETYEGETIKLSIIGVEKLYKARRTRNLLNEFNNIAYNNNKKAFEYVIEDVIEDFSEQLFNNTYALAELDVSDSILKSFHKLMYRENKQGELLVTNSFGKFLSTNPPKYQIKDKLKGMLWSSFYKNNISILPADKIRDIFHKQGIMYSGNFVDLNNDDNNQALQFILRNTYRTSYQETNRGDSLKDKFFWNPETVFGESSGTTKEVLVQFTDLTYGYVELISTNEETILFNSSGKEIQDFFTYSGSFNSLAEKYNITKGGFNQESLRKWNEINDGGFNQEYFSRLTDLYKGGNKNYGDVSLKFKEVPQVSKNEEQSTAGKIKDSISNKTVLTDLGEYAKSYLLKEDSQMVTEKYTDENGEEQTRQVPISREKQYINRQKVRTISAKFNTTIPLNDLETNLYKSILLYKTASNSFRGLKNNESQALLLQTILEGDEKLGIKPRAVKMKDKNGKNIQVTGGGIKFKDVNVRSSEMILSFINDYIYGIEREDYGILGSSISAKKIAGMMSSLTAYSALAWNISTMPANHLISLHNTRAVSKDNQWFNETDWKKAIGVYTLNYGNFFNDFRSKGFNSDKSFLTQLVNRFNALQGEFLSPNGIIVSKNIGEKMMDNSLFWTQNLVEHANQTESMIMLMMGYKLTDNNGKETNLWEALEEANKDRNEGPIIIPSFFTREDEIKFQKRLHGVNRQIHGNYQKIDKTMLQKGILTNMMMTFKRFIYDGFRSRFMEERYDQELRDEQEGYFRTYLKSLNTEFTEIAKTQGFTAALYSKGFKTVGNSLLKTSLAGWDAATGRLLSKNGKVKNYLYGENITERQYYAAMRATYDVGNVIRVMLMGVLIESILSGLDDDDEVTRAMLSYANIYANRLESDIGFFTSFTNFATGSYAGPTLDQMFRFLKEPFAAVRAMDNTSGIFTQLISHDWVDEEGNFGFTWHGLDQYEKSGNGYEKGDYKIARKFKKSILSPWWQIIKSMDYESQLKYQGLIYKHTK